MSDAAGAGTPPPEDEKRQLEIEKLRLENEELERRRSTKIARPEWLQAITVAVAMAAAVATGWLGFNQLTQNTANQAADRFDRAVTRFASTRAEERLTGVAGLRLFLDDSSNPAMQKQALAFMVNGLSTEDDQRVGGSIINTITGLKPGQLSQDALDAALQIAVERNRNLTKLLVDTWPQRIETKKKQALAKAGVEGFDKDGTGGEITGAVLAKLSPAQYFAFLAELRGPFHGLERKEQRPLYNLSTAIETLLKQGAVGRDFWRVNCEACDFRSAKTLDGANFEDAWVARANFSGMSLKGASFENADIGGANFFGADLTSANLSTGVDRDAIHNVDFQSRLPLLECAKLKDADLSGQALLYFQMNREEFEGRSYRVATPRMMHAEIDASTKLRNFKIIIASTASDDVYPTRAQGNDRWPLIARVASDLRPDPLTMERMDIVALDIVARYQASAQFNARKVGHTAAVRAWLVSDAAEMLHPEIFISGVPDGRYYMLQDYVDQPALQALPLFAAFAKRVASYAVPESPDGRWTRWRTADREMLRKQTDCASNPGRDTLLIDSNSLETLFPPRDKK